MPEDTSREALRAQQDPVFFNTFIEKNKRFMMSCAYRAAGRFITESDDEWSVTMIAFSEAVKSYDIEKGDFNAFAALVIRRRLQDHFKAHVRYRQEVPLDPDDETIPAETPQTAVRDEIEAMQQVLVAYGFSFFDLVKCSPKAGKTKAACAEAVRCLVAEEALAAKMRDTRTLPAAEIKKRVGVPQKILERHRKYIIAAAEILQGDFPLLAEYIAYIRQ